MKLEAKIYIAGHTGLLGSALVRHLTKTGHSRLILKTRQELDLLDKTAVHHFLSKERPEYVFVSAARVGGILENQRHQGTFLYENAQIQNHLLEGARLAKVKKLLFVSSTCVYPAQSPQPIKEEYLLTGRCEPTNEGYALAKIMGMKLCEFYRQEFGCDFIVACPTNLFGINDSYDLEKCHLLPALIHRIHQAKVSDQRAIELWGSGRPRREFMLSDDCADALVFLMQHYSSSEPINVGTGCDASVLELAETVAHVLEAKVEFQFDTRRPDGMMRKQTDVSKIRALGWQSEIPIEEGIRIAYADFLARIKRRKKSESIPRLDGFERN